MDPLCVSTEAAEACNGSHMSIGRVAFSLLKNKYVYCATYPKKWYVFDGNVWSIDIEHVSLMKDLITIVKNHYIRALENISMKARMADMRLTVTSSKFKHPLQSVIRLLGDYVFISHVIKLMRVLFDNRLFYQKLDTNCDIIAFKNCIWELKSKTVRAGTPEDYVSLCVKYDYIPEVNESIRSEVIRYWEILHPNKEQRDYTIKMFARQLCGNACQNLLHIHAGFQGSAANGKTSFFDILQSSLGSYMGKLGIDVLTTKQQIDSYRPFPALNAWRGQRILYATEPNNTDILNTGIVKALTGCESVTYRMLFSNDILSYRPQFKLHLQCNDPPKADGADSGIQRRIRKIDYISQFVPNEKVDETRNKFLMDDTFLMKVRADNRYKMEFLRYLLDSYDDNFGFEMPEVVRNAGKEYIEDNDAVFKFVEEHIIASESGHFVLKEAKDRFRGCEYYNYKPGTLKNNLLKCLKLQKDNVKCIAQKKVSGCKLCNVFEGFELVQKDTSSPMENRFKAELERVTGLQWIKVRPLWLCNPETGVPMELDMYNEETKTAVEYNGRQHYEYPNDFHESKEDFDAQQRRDVAKKESCRIRGVKLIIIDAQASLEDEMKCFYYENANR